LSFVNETALALATVTIPAERMQAMARKAMALMVVKIRDGKADTRQDSYSKKISQHTIGNGAVRAQR